MNSQLTASSGTADKGRLYNTAGSWCSSTLSNMEYIQVDLGRTYNARGVATQGDATGSFWLTTFSIAFSFDNTTWYNLTTENKSSLEA